MEPFPLVLMRIGAINPDTDDVRTDVRRDDGTAEEPRAVDRALIQHRSTCL